MVSVATIQMVSSCNIDDNLKQVEKLVTQASEQGAQLAVLPEYFAFMGMREEDKVTVAEQHGNGLIQNFISTLARKNQIWIIAGSIPILSEDKNRCFGRCQVYSSQGNLIDYFDKIHLFDVSVTGEEKYLESKSTQAGNKVIVIDSPFGRIGLAICYDLRFPELFQKMHESNVEIIALPAAFTETTGKAHWEVLLRARAIENQCYVIASGQGGLHENKRSTFGHSMIIDPWGKVLNCIKQGEGFVLADIDLNFLHEIRQSFPTLTHKRVF